jgi:segregation and condensation protein B
MSDTPSHDPHPLGLALRARRTAVGMTLEDLAPLVGISPGQISRIETGRSQPRYATLLRLRDALGLEGAHAELPAPRPSPDDGVVARLGAILVVHRSLPLGEASKLLEVSIATLKAAATELAERLAPVGMAVVEDGQTIALVPHRALRGLVERAVVLEDLPHLTASHLEVLAIVVHTGAITRKRVDEVRGVDSAETVAQLVEWGLLRREGADGRAPLYRATAKLVEVTGAASLEELRHRLGAVMAESRRAHGGVAAGGEDMPMELTAS